MTGTVGAVEIVADTTVVNVIRNGQHLMAVHHR